MILYRTTDGPVVERDGAWHNLGDIAWDDLLTDEDLPTTLAARCDAQPATDRPAGFDAALLPPVHHQEVWGCGVTYYRSRDARMEESKDAGGGDFYDRVYSADRPELFFKTTAHRVAGHGQPVRIRRDTAWSVPEPELTLVVTPAGRIVGYTVGNDMSARDIEGENPLYLPQAKTYDGCCALGPGLLITDQPMSKSARITLDITRGGERVFQGETDLTQLKREPAKLVEWLMRDNRFPAGCLMLTGTGIIPPNDFTLHAGDKVSIAIDGIGTLTNPVVQG